MADFAIWSATSSSIEVFLILDGIWAQGERTVRWYRGEAGGGIPDSKDFEESSGPVSLVGDRLEFGGNYEFTGLEPDTEYGFFCTIHYGSELLGTAYGYASTAAEDSGGDEEATWDYNYLGRKSSATDSTFVKFTMAPSTLYKYRISFANSGIATFYTTSEGIDTIGYLGTTSAYDDEQGEPENSLTNGDDYAGDPNFYFHYEVEKDVDYKVWVRGYSGEETGEVTLNILPPEGSIAIEKWDWGKSNLKASVEQTEDAYDAVLNKKAVKNFSYLVWNDMVNKVDEIIGALGRSWDPTYATLSGTRISGVKTLTATKFNSLRNNIELVGGYCGLGKITDGYTSGKIPHPVYSYDDDTADDIRLKTVYGHYFTTLTDYINDCIDNLP